MPIFVSASDSLDGEKRKAEFLCDGISDEIEINFAIKEKMMTSLLNKYEGISWFDSIKSYCLSGSLAIEERLDQSLRYVTIHRDNRTSFSIEFASILRDCCSIFGSSMYALLQGSGAITKSKSDIGDYRDFLRKEVNDIHRMTIQVFSLSFPKE